VEAARRLRADGVVARFVLMGDNDPGNSSAIRPSGSTPGTVEWRRWREDILAVFTQAHLLCLPSYHLEGVPKTPIEAAARGRAIVATDIPGCRDIVRHQEHGSLVRCVIPEL
jgi:glycosyltransferase involved in cell wall biosynthesis